MKLLYVNGNNAIHFDKENKKYPVFAKYFSPTCPACIAMEDQWNDMCKEVEEKYDTDVILAQIDPTGMNKLENMNTYSDVDYVPSIVLLKNGEKVKEYDGAKEKDKMIDFLLENGLIHNKMKGGMKRKTNKRKTSKRKTSKRKTSKRKTSKRKTSKRKTSKRKTSKRKTSKRNP